MCRHNNKSDIKLLLQDGKSGLLQIIITNKSYYQAKLPMDKISTPFKTRLQTPDESMNLIDTETKHGPSGAVISFIKNFARNYRPAFGQASTAESDPGRLLPGYCLS